MKLILIFILIYWSSPVFCETNPSTDADYLVVTNTCLNSGVWYPQLLSILEGRGFTPGLYEFDDQTSSDDIKDYIFTADQTGRGLDYVLLVGAGANINPARLVQPKEEIIGFLQPIATCTDENIVPFQYVSMEIWNGMQAEIPTDDPYIREVDNQPSYSIGRIPVTSAGEMFSWVLKLNQYYMNLHTYNPIYDKITFLGMDVDNPWNGLLGQGVDKMFTLVNSGIPQTTETINVFASEINPENAWTNEPVLVQSFIEMVNNGASLIQFFSTGADAETFGRFFRDISDQDYPNYDTWHQACDYSLFENSDSYPFIMGNSCEIGRIQYPEQENNIMQSLMLLPNAGTIGFAAPTILSSQLGCQEIALKTYQNLFSAQFLTLSEAIAAGKNNFAYLVPNKSWNSTGLVYFGDPAMPSPVYRHLSGNLSENQTWNGAVVVDNSITIEPEITLNIRPGTTIYFSQNSKLEVEGNLIASGTEMYPIVFSGITEAAETSAWGGIVINDGHVEMEYANLHNSSNGAIAVNGQLATGWIRNSNLHDNNKGLSLTNVNDEFEVRDNAIHHNQTGIFTRTSQADMIGNHVYDNDQTGLLLTAGTNGYMANNEIDHNGNGIFNAAGMRLISSSPIMSKTLLYDFLPQENNIIHDNNGYGIYSSFTGLPNLGTCRNHPPKISGGFNHFYNNSNTALYRNDNPGTHPDDEPVELPADNPSLMAQVNYWFPSLDDDTAPGANEIHGAVNWSYLAATFNNGDPNDDYEEIALLGDGLKAEQDAEYEVAIDFYQQFLDSDPLNKDQMIAAMSGMDRCYGHLKEIDQWQAILVQIAANFDKEEQQKLAQNYLIWVYKKLGLDAEAIAQAQALIDDCSDPEYIDYYTLEIALLLDETDGGILAKPSPEQRQMADQITKAQNHLLGTDIHTEAADVYKLIKGIPLPAASVFAIPNSYALHPAYPNPFNPVTTLSFDLPAASQVQLVIYDIQGREVTRLINDRRAAGTYTTQWQGRDESGRMVASGLYFYTLEAVASGSDERFRASRKLLLMK